MLILSQDKKTIFNFERIQGITVIKSLAGGKDRRYILYAVPQTLEIGNLGGYADEETAMNELQRIMDAAKRGEDVYYVG